MSRCYIQNLTIFVCFFRNIGLFHTLLLSVDKDGKFCMCDVVECRTCNRESSFLNNPFVALSKFGQFRSLHDASVHSAI